MPNPWDDLPVIQQESVGNSWDDLPIAEPSLSPKEAIPARSIPRIGLDILGELAVGGAQTKAVTGTKIQMIGDAVTKIAEWEEQEPIRSKIVKAALQPLAPGMIGLSMIPSSAKKKVGAFLSDIGETARKYYEEEAKEVEETLVSKTGRESQDYAWQVAKSTAQSLPQMVADVALTKGIMGGKVLSHLSANISSSVMEGVSAGSQERQQVEHIFDSMSEENLNKIPFYQEAIEKGMKPEEAKRTARKQAGQRAFVEDAISTSLTSMALGGTLEKFLLSGSTGKKAIRTLFNQVAGESIEEGIQSGFDQMWQNYETGKRGTELLDGVRGSMEVGAGAGALMAGAIAPVASYTETKTREQVESKVLEGVKDQTQIDRVKGLTLDQLHEAYQAKITYGRTIFSNKLRNAGATEEEIKNINNPDLTDEERLSTAENVDRRSVEKMWKEARAEEAKRAELNNAPKEVVDKIANAEKPNDIILAIYGWRASVYRKIPFAPRGLANQLAVSDATGDTERKQLLLDQYAKAVQKQKAIDLRTAEGRTEAMRLTEEPVVMEEKRLIQEKKVPLPKPTAPTTGEGMSDVEKRNYLMERGVPVASIVRLDATDMQRLIDNQDELQKFIIPLSPAESVGEPLIPMEASTKPVVPIMEKPTPVSAGEPITEGGYKKRGLQSAIKMRREEPQGSLANYGEREQAEWLGETPEETVTLYRATLTGEPISPGDYVTNNKQYAKDHIKANMGGKGKITTIDATLDDIYPADGPKEFWYVPKEILPDAVKEAGPEKAGEAAMPPEQMMTEAKKYKTADSFINAKKKLKGIKKYNLVTDDSFDELIAAIDKGLEDNPRSHAVGLRGLWKQEIGKSVLRDSFEWTDENGEITRDSDIGTSKKGRRMDGTSVINLKRPWNEMDRDEAKKELERAISTAGYYGDGEVAIVLGHPNLNESWGDDVAGEAVFQYPKVIGYIDDSVPTENHLRKLWESHQPLSPAAKPPEQMTPEQFIESKYKELGGKDAFKGEDMSDQEAMWKDKHRDSVERSIRSGVRPPDVVLDGINPQDMWELQRTNQETLADYVPPAFRDWTKTYRQFLAMNKDAAFPSDTIKAWHKRVVQRALSEGRDVPSKVLADYPDLTQPPSPTPAAKPPEAGKQKKTMGEASRFYIEKPEGVKELAADVYSSHNRYQRTSKGEDIRERTSAEQMLADLGVPKEQILKWREEEPTMSEVQLRQKFGIEMPEWMKSWIEPEKPTAPPAKTPEAEMDVSTISEEPVVRSRSEIRLKGKTEFQPAWTDNKGFMHTEIKGEDVIVGDKRVAEVQKPGWRGRGGEDLPKIVSATFTKDGVTTEGLSHREAAKKQGVTAPVRRSGRETPAYGFMDAEGKVLTQEEAMRRARDTGQLKPDAKLLRGKLHSDQVEFEKEPDISITTDTGTKAEREQGVWTEQLPEPFGRNRVTDPKRIAQLNKMSEKATEAPVAGGVNLLALRDRKQFPSIRERLFASVADGWDSFNKEAGRMDNEGVGPGAMEIFRELGGSDEGIVIDESRGMTRSMARTELMRRFFDVLQPHLGEEGYVRSGDRYVFNPSAISEPEKATTVATVAKPEPGIPVSEPIPEKKSTGTMSKAELVKELEDAGITESKLTGKKTVNMSKANLIYHVGQLRAKPSEKDVKAETIQEPVEVSPAKKPEPGKPIENLLKEKPAPAKPSATAKVSKKNWADMTAEEQQADFEKNRNVELNENMEEYKTRKKCKSRNK